jgi:uncharacterized membrane protein YeaQ/YmgE (transglycosylase-associated protein family)
MANNFRIGLLETGGLAILGGTVGALLGGAADGNLDVYGFLGAIIGAAVPFLIVLMPKRRSPSRRRPT